MCHHSDQLTGCNGCLGIYIYLSCETNFKRLGYKASKRSRSHSFHCPLLVRGCFSFLVTWVPGRVLFTELTLLLSFGEKHVMSIIPWWLPEILEKGHKISSIVKWKIMVANKQLCNLKEDKAKKRGREEWETERVYL